MTKEFKGESSSVSASRCPTGVCTSSPRPTKVRRTSLMIVWDEVGYGAPWTGPWFGGRRLT